MGHPLKSEKVKEALRRFPNLPLRTLARYLLDTNGGLWDNDLDKIRDVVRYWAGKQGTNNRLRASDKSLFRDANVPLPPTWRTKRTPYQMPHGLWLILSDLHVPFHEQVPLEAAVSAGQAEKVDGVFFNGDFQDCAAISYWPTAKRDWNAEVEATTDTLDWLRHEFPDQTFIYKPGNHEYRLPRYFVSKAPDLAESPLAAMETVLDFESRDIEFLDYFQIVQFGKLPVIHGHEIRNINKSVNPARGLYLKAKTFAACSHCHSTSMHTPRTIYGDLLTTWSFGCLCDLNPDYNPYGTDWNWGFALINVEKNGNFEVINRRILKNGKVV
jgi:predicted phosphodiesterase